MYRCASISPSFLYPISLQVYLGRRLGFSRDFSIFFAIFEGFDSRQILGTFSLSNCVGVHKVSLHFTETVPINWFSRQSPYHWHCNPYTFIHLTLPFNRIQRQFLVVLECEEVLKLRHSKVYFWIQEAKCCQLGEAETLRTRRDSGHNLSMCKKIVRYISPRGIKKDRNKWQSWVNGEPIWTQKLAI